jgi:tetratricopeptide (TPR) repeat protein
VIKLDPRYYGVYCDRAFIYTKQRQFQAAIESCNEALRISHRNSAAYSIRGHAYFYLKEYQQALRDCTHAIELDPNNDGAYNNIGKVYLGLCKLEKARDAFAKSCALNPRFARHRWFLEWTEMCLKQTRPGPEEATQLGKIATFAPKNYNAQLCRGIALCLCDNYAEGLVELERVILEEPNEWGTYFWVGITSASLGNNKEAIDAIEHALKLGMPPVLMTPLHWLKESQPEFYQHHALQLLTHISL